MDVIDNDGARKHDEANELYFKGFQQCVEDAGEAEDAVALELKLIKQAYDDLALKHMRLLEEYGRVKAMSQHGRCGAPFNVSVRERQVIITVE